ACRLKRPELTGTGRLVSTATSASTRVGSTDWSTCLLPSPAVRCSLLQSRCGLVAARFSQLHDAAAILAGLLIPRSQVRSLPGPFTGSCIWASYVRQDPPRLWPSSASAYLRGA